MKAVFARVRFARDHRWAPTRMSGFLDLDLTADQQARMERHVSQCPQCRGVLGGLRLLVEALHRLPAPEGADVALIAASVRVRIAESGPG
jgi:hypothetical protein